jgi:SAM-dependent methyltransferase
MLRRLVKAALTSLFEAEASLARRWTAAAHRRLLYDEWFISPNPEYFDHHIDLFYQWFNSRNSLWIERGAFGSLALQGGDVLELACGDGFNARNFYSLRSRQVVACDFDPNAITTARRKNSAPNVRFVLADIRTAMPDGLYQNIVWDAAIEHFTPAEIQQILLDIKERLAPGGILSGYTIVERGGGAKHIHQHEYEFRDMADLESFLAPHFANVTVFETIYPDRHNLYFWASDGAVPFDPEWASIRRSRGYTSALPSADTPSSSPRGSATSPQA